MTVPPLDVVLPDGESSEVPEMPETITEVDTAQEAVKSLEDLWNNLRYQHREKFKEYSELQASLSAMNFDQGETRVDFTKMNEMRDDIVKLELLIALETDEVSHDHMRQPVHTGVKLVV